MYKHSTAVYPLFDLEQLLHSNKERLKLTPEEANIWLSWKSEARRNFTVGAVGGGTAVWAATRKLNGPFRMFLSSGAAVSIGSWILVRSMYSFAEKILEMDGSILQKELANIMMTKYQNEPTLRPLMSKHFYSERIFDDSTSKNPNLRWRFRNFFSDNAIHDHRTHDNDYYDDTQVDSHSDVGKSSQGESENVNDSRKTNLETKHNFTKAGPEIMAELDPLDFLFGYGSPVEEIHYSNTPNKPSGTHNRRQRRSHRRHRMRNPDDLSNSKHASSL
ncbi:hypothetical protein Lal_00032094 [Lupinus albus]|uniref:Uncharacterized protein n=1 Tax=Lupinus albus TaxID=3870 RepID=A0A6A5PNH8_LUPAL|nr:hypothetical protein Lalb_Chr01g0013131 [Lupinus albus]KAF1898514.1 hypothetical protein Lal_00032094 [Lupinus albus]